MESCCNGILFTNLNDKAMLAFQEHQCLLHIMFTNYQLFMYAAHDLVMTLRGGFSPSSGLMCEIVNSVDQGNFTFFRKSQRISETSGCVQIKTTIFGTNEQSSYFSTPWFKLFFCFPAV